MDIMQLLQMGNNPQMQNNPLFQRALQMTKGKSEADIKQIVLNVAKQRGVNVDQLNAMISSFGYKL